MSPVLRIGTRASLLGEDKTRGEIESSSDWYALLTLNTKYTLLI